jgi:hypothetical protein
LRGTCINIISIFIIIIIIIIIITTTTATTTCTAVTSCCTAAAAAVAAAAAQLRYRTQAPSCAVCQQLVTNLFGSLLFCVQAWLVCVARHLIMTSSPTLTSWWLSAASAQQAQQVSSIKYKIMLVIFTVTIQHRSTYMSHGMRFSQYYIFLTFWVQITPCT